MTTWVFAGVNGRDRLPQELLSRFVNFDFQPYTREAFLEVAEEVITGQLGKDPDLARYVAERVVLRTKDVRQAIQVAKLCESPEEVDRFERERRAESCRRTCSPTIMDLNFYRFTSLASGTEFSGMRITTDCK